MEGFDLTRFQEKGENQEKIRKIMGKVLSGRNGYEAVIEERKDIKRCSECNWGHWKVEKNFVLNVEQKSNSNSFLQLFLHNHILCIVTSISNLHHHTLFLSQLLCIYYFHI